MKTWSHRTPTSQRIFGWFVFGAACERSGARPFTLDARPPVSRVSHVWEQYC